MRHRHKFSLLLIAGALALGGCGSKDKAVDDDRGGFAGLADKAVSEMRNELATENMAIGRGKGSAPRAEISPQGDLIIDGEKVKLDAAQQALVLQYRKNLAGVAEAGAQIGLEAAALAGNALGEVAKGALQGKSDDVEKRLQAEAEGIRVAALGLCDRLPGLYASELALAAAVPEFVPYAKMQESDITECHREINKP